MTQSTIPYYKWNSRQDNFQWEQCSPSLIELFRYFARKYPGLRNFGCENDRFIAGTFTWSDHAWGSAFDMRFPSDAITLEVCNWLPTVSKELGINAIHDYGGRNFARQRIWKPIVGWRFTHAIGSAGGDWLHIETNLQSYWDGRTVENKLRLAPPTPPPPQDFLPEWAVWGLYPFNQSKAAIGPFSQGDLVRYLHGVMHWKAQQPIRWARWDVFDGATMTAVNNIQNLGKVKYPAEAVGIGNEQRLRNSVGKFTWALIDRLARGTF